MPEEQGGLSHDDQRRAHWTSWGANFGTIYVTGPHRSGTRIGAKMIANVTLRDYIDEHEFEHDTGKFREYSGSTVVVQCPGMLRWIADLAAAPDGFGRANLVVMMMRNLQDIYASEVRVEWPWEAHEMAKFVQGRPMLPGAVSSVKGEADPDEPQVIGQPGIVSPTTQGNEPRSAEVKYWFWQAVIKPDIIRNYRGRLEAVEEAYPALSWHPFWVPKERRKHFKWDQIHERHEDS